jgi:hypothetical protein
MSNQKLPGSRGKRETVLALTNGFFIHRFLVADFSVKKAVIYMSVRETLRHMKRA